MAAFTVVMFWLLGVPGNSIVIEVYRKKPVKSASNLYILALAVMDWAICMFFVPLLPLVLDSAIPPAAQEVWHSCLLFSVLVSIGLLVLIGVDRHRTICRPLCPALGYTKAQVLVGALVVGCAVVSSLTGLIVTYPVLIQPYMYFLGGYLVLCLIAIGLLYSRIFWSLTQRKKVGSTPVQAISSAGSTTTTDLSTGASGPVATPVPPGGRPGGQPAASQSQDAHKKAQHLAKTAKMLAVVTLVFVISYVSPYILSYFVLHKVPVHWIFTSYINHVANPIIYSFMNPKFREDMVKVLKKVFRRY